MKPQLLFLFILEKTKYLKVGHYLEPSRCKTTSTVTFSLEIQASTSILFQSIREHNIPNTVDLQKKQNPNIQPYKIIRHVSLRWAPRLAETLQSVCMVIFTLTSLDSFLQSWSSLLLWMVLKVQPQSLLLRSSVFSSQTKPQQLDVRHTSYCK